MYLITGREESDLIRRWDWHRLIDLALIGGWSPEEESAIRLSGARRHARGGREFGGIDVTHNEVVRISPGDGASLANALASTLPDIPDHSATTNKAADHRDLRGNLHSRQVWPGEIITALEDFSGPRKGVVKEWVQRIRRWRGFTIRPLG